MLNGFIWLEYRPVTALANNVKSFRDQISNQQLKNVINLVN